MNIPYHSILLYTQVNHSPSFHTDSKLDIEIKDTLLFDTLNLVMLVNFGSVDKWKIIEEEERRIVKKQMFQRQVKSKKSVYVYFILTFNFLLLDLEPYK